MTFAIPNPLFATPADHKATLEQVGALGKRLSAGMAPSQADIALVAGLMEDADRPQAKVMITYLFTALWTSPTDAPFTLLDHGLEPTMALGVSSTILSTCAPQHAPRLAAWILAHRPSPIDEMDVLLLEMLVDWNAAIVRAWQAGDATALADALRDHLQDS
jgi:hypothetical protein